MVLNLNKNKGEADDQRQRKDQVSFMRKYVVKIMNAASLFCTISGAGLLSAILYGHINIHDYKNIELASNCGYGLLIAAVLLGFLALVLPYFKKDCQSIEPAAVERIKNLKTVQDNSNLIKNAASSENDIVKLESRKDKCKQVIYADASSLTNNKTSSSNPLQPTDASKKTQTSRAIDNSCTASQHSDKAKIPSTERQLVPVQNSYSRLFNKNSNAVVQYPAPQGWNFISNDLSGNFPVTEEITSRRVSYLAKNVAQEEFYVKRTYTHPRGSEMPQYRAPINVGEYIRKSEEYPKSPVSDVITSFQSMNFLH